MSKYAKMGAFVAVFAVALMLCAGFSMAQVDFRKSTYEASAGTNAEMLIDLDYTPLNTTADDIESISFQVWTGNESDPTALNTMSDEDIDYICDFDEDTFANISYDGSATDAYYLYSDYDLDYTGTFWINLAEPIDHFDGVWLKKTQQTQLVMIEVYNNTMGAGSEGVLMNEDDTNFLGTTFSNKSFEFCGNIFNDGLGSVQDWNEYIEMFGSIDNLTISFYSAYATTESIETLLYEFHLFNARPYIDTVVITNEAGDQTLAWGTDTEQDGSVVTLTVSIPATATAGAYFVTATDNLGNTDTTTLRVSENLVTDSNNIIITLLCIIGGGALLATAGILANSKKDWEGVVVLTVVGVIVLGYGVIRALDTAGYIPAGWPGYGFAGFIPVGLVGLCTKKDEDGKRRFGKKALALGLAGVLALCVLMPLASATNTVTPANRTSNQGDVVTFTLTSDAETGYYDEEEITVSIYKVDVVLSPIEVFWTYTVTVSEDELTATVRITIPSGAAAGTYTVEIDQPQEDVNEEVTIYIPEEQGLNLPILFTMVLGGIVLAFVFPALSWAAVKKTKGKADDAFVIIAAVLGVLMLVGAAAYYFGYWTL